jgi:hypothetical protein
VGGKKSGGGDNGDRLGFFKCPIWDGKGTENARGSRWREGDAWSNGFFSKLSRLVGVVKSDSSSSSPYPFFAAPMLHRLVLTLSASASSSGSGSCSEGGESASEELSEM